MSTVRDEGGLRGRVESIRQWLDEHSKTHRAVRETTRLLGLLVFVALVTVIGFIAGGVLAFCLVGLWVSVIGFEQVEVSVQIMARGVYLLALLGGVAGFAFGLRESLRMGAVYGPRPRPRYEEVASVVAQAVVARKLGLWVKQLDIGLSGRGRVSTSRLVDLTAGEPGLAQTHACDDLVVLLAGGLNSPVHSPQWIAQVDAAAQAITIDDALSPVPNLRASRDELIAVAARRARQFLDTVPASTLEQITDELVTAGVIRGSRFAHLMAPVVIEPSADDDANEQAA